MPDQSSWTNKEIGLLKTVLVLAQWDQRLPRYIVKLFRHQDQYQQGLGVLRAALAKPDQQAPANPTNSLEDDEWNNLYSRIVAISALRDLFKSETDPFAGVTFDQVQVMAGLSDISTDPKTMFYTRDEAFMDILAASRQLTPPDTNKLIMQGLERFLFLAEAGNEFVELVADLASSSDWQVVLASLRDRRDYTEGSGASQTLEKWNRKLTQELRTRIFSPNYLCRVPQELVRLAYKGRGLFIEALSLATDLDDLAARGKRLAAAASPLFDRDHPVELSVVRANLQLRFDVVRYLTDVRRFAKMDAFVYSWPNVAALARARYKGLEFLEECFLEKRVPSVADLKAEGAEELYPFFTADPQLVNFLELRPYFGEIDENLFIGYKPMSPVTVDTTSPRGATLPSTSEPPTPTTQGSGIASLAGSRVVTIAFTEPDYVATGTKYKVSLSIPNTTKSSMTEPLDIENLVREILAIIGSTSPDYLQAFLKDFFSETGPKAKMLLQLAGKRLYEAVFPADVRDVLGAMMAGDQILRIVIETKIDELVFLPWEWLPDTSQDAPVVRLSRFSLVRSLGAPDQKGFLPLTLPLKVLVIRDNPDSIPGHGEAANVLESVLRERAHAQYINTEQFSDEAFNFTLKSLRPQIVHFDVQSSYGVTIPESSGRGLLSFTLGQLQDIQSIANILIEVGVRLVVFANNDMGAIYQNRMAEIAMKFAEQGIPAVLAPVHGVDEITASNFMVEFYGSFLQGATLELAVSEARSRIARRGGDWSAFALFANPSVLDLFSALRSAS